MCLAVCRDLIAQIQCFPEMGIYQLTGDYHWHLDGGPRVSCTSSLLPMESRIKTFKAQQTLWLPLILLMVAGEVFIPSSCKKG